MQLKQMLLFSHVWLIIVIWENVLFIASQSKYYLNLEIQQDLKEVHDTTFN